MRSASLAFVAAALVGGCAPDAPRAAAPIVDGTLEAGMPEVVAIVIRDAQLCTGTLIAPSVVLTAKHCVQQRDATLPDPPSDFRVGVGASIRSFDRVASVRAVYATEGAWGFDASGATTGLLGRDVGLLVLERPVLAVPYPRIVRERPPELIGSTVTDVGYGFTPEGEVGDKRRADSVVRGVIAGTIITGPTACNGDSGGPLRTPDGSVIAVASVAGCDGADIGGFSALWPHLALIDDAAAAAGECLASDADERCDGATDEDCDGVVDEGCAVAPAADAGCADCTPDPIAGTPAGGGCAVGGRRSWAGGIALALFGVLSLAATRRARRAA